MMLAEIDVLTEALSPRARQALAHNVQLPPLERLALARLLLESVLRDAHREDAEWTHLGLAAFQQDWDNAEDAVYDEWKEHYGITTR